MKHRIIRETYANGEVEFVVQKKIPILGWEDETVEHEGTTLRLSYPTLEEAKNSLFMDKVVKKEVVYQTQE